MKFSLKDIVYSLIIIISLLFIFPRTFEGYSCGSSNPRQMINDSDVLCIDGQSNVEQYQGKDVKCDENDNPYVMNN